MHSLNKKKLMRKQKKRGKNSRGKEITTETLLMFENHAIHEHDYVSSLHCRRGVLYNMFGGGGGEG